MIHPPPPIVHRFFHFTTALLCAIAILLSPFQVQAATVFYDAFYNVSLETEQSDSGGTYTIGIYFTATTTMTGINRVDLSVMPAFNPDDGVRLNVFTTTDGSEKDSFLAQSIYKTVAEWPQTSGVDASCYTGMGSDLCSPPFYFNAPFTLIGGQKYLFMIERSDSGGSGDWRMGLHASAPTNTDYQSWKCDSSEDCTSHVSDRYPAMRISYDETFGGDPCEDGLTRICGFTPENGTVIESTEGFAEVEFTLDAYINAEDVDGSRRVKVRLHNIDQNVLLLGFFSPSDIYLVDETLAEGEDGHFEFASTTPLADGNYRLEAWIEKTIFFGWLNNPFDETADQVISKQFIVGEGTFIGNLSQNGFSMLNGELVGQSATSSLALVARCNPLGDLGFDMVKCLSGLFIPDAGQVQTTITGMRDGILIRMPWGYVTRVGTILSGNATTTLPSFSTTFALNDASDLTTLTFNPGDMLAGGGALLDSIEDPYTGATTRTVFEPMIRLAVALMVILTIVADVTGSHKHSAEPGEVASRRKRT